MRGVCYYHCEAWLILKNAYPAELRGQIAHHLSVCVNRTVVSLGVAKVILPSHWGTSSWPSLGGEPLSYWPA